MKQDDKDIIIKAISSWQERGLLTQEKSEELSQDIKSIAIEKSSIAHYFFIIAVSCIVLAFGALFIDEKIIEQLKNYFALSNYFIASICGLITVAWHVYIYKKSVRLSTSVFEGHTLLGGLLLLTSLVYFCKELGFGPSYSGFLLTSAILFSIISFTLQSRIAWVMCILAIMGAYGAYSEWKSIDNLFLGMNYPMRFTVFGILVITFSIIQKNIKTLEFTRRITYVIGLLIFFSGLWGVSIFGNYGKMNDWLQVRQIQVIGYSLIFAAVAIFAFVYGLKKDDSITRDFGLLFILLNLYSRYFEFFWNGMNKGIFFVVLAVSFWLLGRFIEKGRKKNELTA